MEGLLDIGATHSVTSVGGLIFTETLLPGTVLPANTICVQHVR